MRIKVRTREPKEMEWPRTYFGLRKVLASVNYTSCSKDDLRVSLDVNEGPDKGRAVCQRDDHADTHSPDIMRREVVCNPALL